MAIDQDRIESMPRGMGQFAIGRRTVRDDIVLKFGPQVVPVDLDESRLHQAVFTGAAGSHREGGNRGGLGWPQLNRGSHGRPRKEGVMQQ